MRIDLTREANGSVGFYFNTEPSYEISSSMKQATASDWGMRSSSTILLMRLWKPACGRTSGPSVRRRIRARSPVRRSQERIGGNNALHATVLGSFGHSGGVSVGLDSTDSVVDQFDDDWLGVDGTSGTDWFRFSTAANVREY